MKTLYAATLQISNPRSKHFVLSNGEVVGYEHNVYNIPMSKFRNADKTNEIFVIGDDNGERSCIQVGNQYKTTTTQTFIQNWTGDKDIVEFFDNKNVLNFAKSFINDFTGESNPVTTETSDELDSIRQQIRQAVNNKPDNLIISDLKWKLLIRSILRGKNLMIVGPTGCGKTVSAKLASKILGRELHVFNMGSTQDPRLSLIGNTTFNPEDGTVFNKSEFVKAITTPNATILIDEITRIHPEGVNILMSVLDPGQRYLRLDESDKTEIIEVAEGVSFIATANIGNEYTSTRTLDRAFTDRFQIFEMDILNREQEFDLLNALFPNQRQVNAKLVNVGDSIKKDYFSESPKFETFISTRVLIETADLIQDEFEFMEAVEMVIYPYFSSEGGVDSERSYLKQILQKDDDGSTVDDTNW